MKCQNCGNQIPDDSVFCPDCGTKIKQDQMPLHIKDLFPIYGMTLGTTTLSDIEKVCSNVSIDKSCADYLDGISLFWNKERKILSDITIYHDWDNWPDKWKQLGMDPCMSYDSWIKFLKENNYDIYIWRGPITESFNGRPCFSASLFATSADETFQFSLDFGGGNRNYEGCCSFSLNSLSSISIRLLEKYYG